MIERFTIDQLAAAIEVEVKTSKPQPKLTRRFFRRGKRDGRRAHSADPVRSYLTHGVSIAASRLAEEYLSAMARKTADRELLDARLQHGGSNAPSAGEPPTVSADAASHSSPDADTGGQGRTSMRSAIAALHESRAAAAAARLAAIAEQQRAAMASLNEQKAELDAELDSLLDKYRQLVESCHSTGRFLWARYCNGYVHGKAREHGNSEIQPPELDIEFDVPQVLCVAGEPKSPAGTEPTLRLAPTN